MPVELFRHCRDEDSFTKKGYRLNLNRFVGFVTVAEEESLRRWHRGEWERSFLCLESDMLKGKGVQKLVLRPGEAEAMADGVGSTCSNRISIEDRSLRSCMQNALAISVCFLQDSLNFRRLNVIVAACLPVKEWHGRQSAKLRSAEASLEFMLSEFGNMEFFTHVHEVLGVTSSFSALERCEFTIPHSPKISDENDLVLLDDEMADSLGQLSVALAFARLKRALCFLQGWPHGLIGLLVPERRERTAKAFTDDLRIFRELKTHSSNGRSRQGDLGRAGEEMLRRHCMNLVVCRQFAAAFDASGGAVTDDIVKLVERNYTGIVSTQLIEDLFGVMKNSNELRGTSRYRRPQRAMGKAITCNVLASV